jgi:nucleotide-binding universal stress UspA family protein
MSIRDILVHVKSYERWSPHIDLAAALAQRFNAYLTGLYNDSDIATLKLIAHGPVGGADFLPERLKDSEAKAAAAQARFVDEMTSRGVAHGFEIAEGRANEVLTLLGRFHDLIVVEQTDRAHDENNWSDAEEAAVRCGRPTLVVPANRSFAEVGKRIVLAWNGSREAARAVHGALPFIEAADEVQVLIGPARESTPSITKLPKMDILAYLRRHTKTVIARELSSKDRDAGEDILMAAADCKADLIVMGAYGRSGLTQLLLGSATGHVLRRLTVPALMAN